MENNEERLTIKKVEKGKKVFLAIARASMDLLSGGSFMMSAFSFIKAIKGNPILSDTIGVNIVYGIIGLLCGIYTTTTSYDLKEMMEGKDVFPYDEMKVTK